MASILIILAAVLAAAVNLFTKKNLDRMGSSQGYLVMYFLFALVSAFFIYPQIFTTQISYASFFVGCAAGALNFFSMLTLMAALKWGSPGLTFAFQNSSAVLPSVLLFFLFGSEFDFTMSPMMLCGIVLVIIGLFWSSNPRLGFKMEEPLPVPSANNNLKKWVIFSIASFFIQGVILSIFQWNSLLINHSSPSHPLLFLNFSTEEAIWFMPGMFITASLLNAKLFFYRERRWFRLPEILYGAGGGLLNGGVTFLLLLSARFASPVEKGIIFPLFAVSVIAFCNIWGQKLYKERVNWMAIALCLIGVFLGSLR